MLPANTSVAEAALLFSRLNAAVWDASIVGWGSKYSDLFWRPITAIRQGDGDKANEAYVNAAWSPELNTPSHPEYPSGAQPARMQADSLLWLTYPRLVVGEQLIY